LGGFLRDKVVLLEIKGMEKEGEREWKNRMIVDIL
jgi:hypothetical protein